VSGSDANRSAQPDWRKRWRRRSGWLAPFVLAAIVQLVAPTEADLSRVDARLQDASTAPTASGIETLDWRTLSGLNHVTGIASSRLRHAAGRTVRIPGFVVPLEDFAEAASEFLLVPYFGACVHTPAPPPNQLVMVEMRSPTKIGHTWGQPVWVEGELAIENVDSPFGVAGYRLVGTRVAPFERGSGPEQ
jgi:hypothetical protein